jgi:hypothetical protein
LLDTGFAVRLDDFVMHGSATAVDARLGDFVVHGSATAVDARLDGSLMAH